MLLLAVQFMLSCTESVVARLDHASPHSAEPDAGFRKSRHPLDTTYRALVKTPSCPGLHQQAGTSADRMRDCLDGSFMMIAITGTNTLPAMSIFIIGFGLLDDDGAISLAGLLLCLIAAIFALSILYALFMGGTLLFSVSL